jgi:AcrR family transcriptional regulator
MNKRQLKKAQTREKILTIAKELFIRQGVLQTTTLEVAKACQIAHGTVFVHFPTKDALIVAILEQELKRMATEVYELAMQSDQLEVLLEKYLQYVEQEEDFLAVIAREMPFYPPELRHSLLAQECIIRHLFFTAIEHGILAGRFKPVDITMALTFLFGAINYYLAHKSQFVAQGSVIKAKKETIYDTFLQFITIEHKE